MAGAPVSDLMDCGRTGKMVFRPGIFVAVGIVCVVALLLFLFALLAPARTIELRAWLLEQRAGLTEKRIVVAGREWPYLEGGKGNRPTIVFLHGFGSNKESWLGLLSEFTADYHVIVPDLPGFGENRYISGESYDARTQVQRLHLFFGKIAPRRFHLVGISMGGFLAGRYAARHPARIDRLVLIAPAGIQSSRPSRLYRYYQTTGKNALLYTNPEEFDRFLKFLFPHPPWVPATYRAYFLRRKLQRLEAQQKIFNELFLEGMDSLGRRLDRIKSPVLLLWGAEDAIVDVSSIRVAKKRLPEVRPVVYPGIGHASVIEIPDKLAAQILSFFKED